MIIDETNINQFLPKFTRTLKVHYFEDEDFYEYANYENENPSLQIILPDSIARTIRKLVIKSTSLSEFVVPENLVSLRILVVYNNPYLKKLTIPDRVYSTLMKLDISWNRLSGTFSIPEVDTPLEDIYIQHNEFTRIDIPDRVWRRLRAINCNMNKLSEFIIPDKCDMLIGFSCASNLITNLVIPECINLKNASFYENELLNTATIHNCGKLEHVYCDDLQSIFILSSRVFEIFIQKIDRYNFYKEKSDVFVGNLFGITKNIRLLA